MAGKMNVYNEMVKAQLESISSDPTGIIGLVYFNTTSNISKYYNGSAWKTFLAADFSNVTGTLPVANGGTGVTTSTGSGNVVLSTSPTLVTPVLGTPASGTLTNATGLPIDGGTVNTLPVSRGGTGQTTATAAFNSLSPTTTIGDISYHNGTDDVRLPIGTDGQALKVLSGIPAWGDGGAGAGEINAILNPSASSATTGWSDDANHSKTRLTSGSPLDPVIATAFRFTKDNTNVSTETSTSGVYYPFTLPTGLESKKLKIEFYCIVPATGTWKVSVYDGSTRLALSTDSSGSTILPAGVTGKFVTYFDATANNSYTVSFTETAGVVTNLDATNIIVGPGIQPQGAVVEEWKSFTPTSNFTNCTHTGFYRRIGDSMQIAVRGIFTASPAAIGQISLNMPTGFTIDTSKVPSGAATSNAVGSAYARDSGVADYIGTVFTTSTTALTVTSGAGASDGWDESRPISWALNDTWSINAVVPISEWAGSGTVNLGQNDVEYASNTGGEGTTNGTTYNSTTYLSYGPSGSQFVSVNSSTLDQYTGYKVRFLTPIQPTDKIEVEVTTDGGNTWLSQSTVNFTIGVNREATAHYGIFWQPINSTDIEVRFGNYGRNGAGTTFGSQTSTWASVAGNSAFKWRVKKSSGGQAVGFGMATATQSGLVSATTQTFAGIKNNASMPAFHVNKNATSQTGLTGATQVTWSEAHANCFDQGSCFASNVFTVPTGAGGVYQFNSTLKINRTAGSGQINAFLRVNGSSTRRVAAGVSPGFTTGNIMLITVSAIFNLAAGDTVDVFVDGGPTYQVDGDVDSTHFSGAKIH